MQKKKIAAAKSGRKKVRFTYQQARKLNPGVQPQCLHCGAACSVVAPVRFTGIKQPSLLAQPGWTADGIKRLFENGIKQMQQWIQTCPEPCESKVARDVTQRLTGDILRTKVIDDQPPSDYFHYHPREGTLALSRRFLETWASHANAKGLRGLDLAGAIQTFVAHEWIHLPQGLNGDKYSDVPDWSQGLRHLDYEADARSIVLCHHFFRRHKPAGWSEDFPAAGLARVIRMALTNMEVFDAFWRPYPQEEMGRDRFLRYVTWHFQHARARQFTLAGLFDVCSEPLFDIEGLPNQIGFWQQPPEHLKVFLTLDKKLYRFRADAQDFAKNLIRAVLRADCSHSSVCFDEMFAQHPLLVGLK